MTYIPHSKNDIDEMLKKIGVNSISELFNQIPDQFKENIEMNIPERKDPFELETIISEIAEKNKLCKSGRSFLGAGLYNHYVPAIVDEISSRQEYYTAYTPYQPEISQGTLTTIFEYQTMMSRLTGLPISNASLYDGATATVEAAR